MRMMLTFGSAGFWRGRGQYRARTGRLAVFFMTAHEALSLSRLCIPENGLKRVLFSGKKYVFLGEKCTSENDGDEDFSPLRLFLENIFSFGLTMSSSLIS